MKPIVKSRSLSSSQSKARKVKSLKKGALKKGAKKSVRRKAVTRVLLVGLGQYLRVGLEACCKAHREIAMIAHCRSVEEAEPWLKRADVVMLDLDSGAPVLEWARRHRASVHLVGVALHPTDPVVGEAWAAGVLSIITSEDAPESHMAFAILCAETGGYCSLEV